MTRTKRGRYCPHVRVAWFDLKNQHGYTNTKTVDPGGNADFTTIQDAIDDFGTPTERSTVLIYSDTYDENVTLGTLDYNIDLIGIDPDGVIIAPASGDGIVITSGLDTSRNNAIRNLTINTVTGHGIKIVHGGTPVPKDIIIEGVTINADGSSAAGIYIDEAENVLISACTIDSDNADGIELIKDTVSPTDITVTNSAITANASGQNGVEGTAVGLSIRNSQINSVLSRAINLSFVNGFVLADSSVVAGLQGVSLSVPTDILIVGSQIESGAPGVELYTATEPLRIADSSITVNVDNAWLEPWCIRNDTSASATLIVERTRLECVQAGSGYAAPIGVDAAPMTLIDCDLIARNTGTGWAIGIDATRPYSGYQMVGGSITTSSVDERQTEVWDVLRDTSPTNVFSMSRVSSSKWKGPINAAGTPRSETQRMLSVDAASDTGILTLKTLSAGEQTFTSGFTQPDVYRTVEVVGIGTWTGFGTNVYVIGTDWGSNPITEKFNLTGSAPIVTGMKPFKTITKIILPASQVGSQEVKVGTTDKLGLYYPLSATTDVLQESRLLSGVYTNQTLGTVDEVYSTVIPSSFSAGDSFEWALLTTP